jgi:anti-sigma-K factor RskA
MTTSGDHESRTTDVHTLAGPYVMDAITGEERTSFVTHLGGCAQCREDVRELREATARLGMAAAVRPRPELKEQTIRAAFMTSQLAPVVGARTEEGRPDPARHRRAWPALRPAGGRRPATALTKFALAAAVLVMVAAVGLGVLMASVMQQLHHSQRQDHMIAAVLNAPDAVMLTAKITTGGTATVVMSHSERRLVFTANGLRPLPSGKTYELWLMGPAGDRPAGMIKPEPDGTAGPAVVSGMKPGDVLGMTVEPASGSSLPTSVIVVVIGQHR